MNKKICDRCGEEISLNQWAQCQNPLFEIRQIYPQGAMSIDLCEDCSKEFVLWVTKSEVENGIDE